MRKAPTKLVQGLFELEIPRRTETGDTADGRNPFRTTWKLEAMVEKPEGLLGFTGESNQSRVSQSGTGFRPSIVRVPPFWVP